METFMYKKRTGTSGISGHLYETKLISLVLFRLLHDDSVLKFCLASNIDDIGAFDDICFKATIAGHDRPVLVLIQAKHRDDENTFLDFDLIKHFYNSYVKVIQKICSTEVEKQDILFNNKFHDMECIFVLYTNANWYRDTNNFGLERSISTTETLFKQPRTTYQSNYADKLNELISTGNQVQSGSQLDYTHEDLEIVHDIILNEEITALAEHFVTFLHNTNHSMNIMLDYYIQKYHVILAQYVVHISVIQSDGEQKWRLLTFRSDFFDTADKLVSLLRRKIYEIIVRKEQRRKAKYVSGSKESSNDEDVENLIRLFLCDPSAISLSPLIGSHVILKDTKFKFTVTRSRIETELLKQINISPLMIHEAVRMKLSSLAIRVPITFGNIDLTIRGGHAKIEKRLNTLAKFICNLCKNSKSIGQYKIITIDDSIGDGFLSPNGGIGSAVGNLLVHDGDTKLLKFTDEYAFLKENTRALLDRLNSNINNICLYRINVTTSRMLPKLVLDFTEEVKAILNKVVIYDKQSSHIGVEQILKQEIECHLKANSAHNFSVKSDTVAIYYHNEVQRWWMSQKTGPYLTKTSDIFKQSVNNIAIEPRMSSIHNTFYMANIKYFGYSFCESAIESIQSIEEYPKIIMRSDVTALTTARVIQFVRDKYNNNYVVLDFKCILSIPDEHYNALITELEKTNKVLIIVCQFVCDTTKMSRKLHKRLDNLVQASEEAKVIIIADGNLLVTLQDYFPRAKMYDEVLSLKDLTTESCRDILNEARVIFQGEEVSLDLLVDDNTAEFVKGAALNKILRGKTIMVGESISDSNYDKIKHLYIDRRVTDASKCSHFMTSFYDIDDQVVLMTAKPGMGKSTLLTHLSNKTKEIKQKVWIVRINLLDHSEVIAKWPKDITMIDALESLKFICQVIVKSNRDIVSISFKEVNNKVYLAECTGNEWVSFELNMFLIFFNAGNVIFLFDGFDEVCPHYKSKVIRLFRVIKQFPQKNRMWVTSRPYVEILSYLERALGRAYTLAHINDKEQQEYLHKVWEENIPITNLTDIQRNNIITFIRRMENQLINMKDSSKATFNKMYNVQGIYEYFYKYLHSHLHQLPTTGNIDEYNGSALDKVLHQRKVEVNDDELTSTPLILYLTADYFINVINQNIDNYKLEKLFNIFTIYEAFVDTQLKMCLRGKNKMDLYNPNIMTRYEKDRAKCIDMHKRLAAYTIFRSLLLGDDFYDEFKELRPFNEDTVDEFAAMIQAIRNGSENTGLISHVTFDNIPVFIHKTFAEYFAAEYIADILKGNKINLRTKILLYNGIYFYNLDIITWLEEKINLDKELNDIILSILTVLNTEDIIARRFAFCLLNHYSGQLKTDQLVRLFQASLEDYERDCFAEYSVDYLKNTIADLDDDARAVHLKILVTRVFAKMKPHLKKHFKGVIANLDSEENKHGPIPTYTNEERSTSDTSDTEIDQQVGVEEIRPQDLNLTRRVKASRKHFFGSSCSIC